MVLENNQWDKSILEMGKSCGWKTDVGKESEVLLSKGNVGIYFSGYELCLTHTSYYCSDFVFEVEDIKDIQITKESIVVKTYGGIVVKLPIGDKND